MRLVRSQKDNGRYNRAKGSFFLPISPHPLMERNRLTASLNLSSRSVGLELALIEKRSSMEVFRRCLITNGY